VYPDAFSRRLDRLHLGTAAAPAPAGTVEPGRRSAVFATANSWHPSNLVDFLYRVDSGPAQIAHATPAAAGSAAQSFVAQLPALRPGQRLDYRAELRRAGQLVATAPDDGSWTSMVAKAGSTSTQAPEPANPASVSPFPAYDTAGKPRFGCGLEFLGALTVQLRAEVVGLTPQGYRINFFVVRGEAHGPRLHGRVRPQGGDWMCIRPDGVGEVDIKITYETPDGALLLEQSGGVFDLGPEGYANVVRGVYTGAPPFFATPTYVTAHPHWQWINQLQCFGFGRVVMNDLRVECDIYAPRIDSAPGLS
jgi:hypothetical protein